jgi:hypothetical protein
VGALLNTVRQHLGASRICLLVLFGCSDGPGPGEEIEIVQYQFALAAFGVWRVMELRAIE